MQDVFTACSNYHRSLSASLDIIETSWYLPPNVLFLLCVILHMNIYYGVSFSPGRREANHRPTSCTWYPRSHLCVWQCCLCWVHQPLGPLFAHYTKAVYKIKAASSQHINITKAKHYQSAAPDALAVIYNNIVVTWQLYDQAFTDSAAHTSLRDAHLISWARGSSYNLWLQMLASGENG